LEPGARSQEPGDKEQAVGSGLWARGKQLGAGSGGDTKNGTWEESEDGEDRKMGKIGR